LIEAKRQEIDAARLKGLTAAQKRRQTQQGLVERRVAGRGLEQQKQQAREQLKPLTYELDLFGKRIEEAKAEKARIEAERAAIAAQQRDIALVRKFVAEGKSTVGLTKSQKKIYREFKEPVEAKRQQQEFELRKAGLNVKLEDLKSDMLKGLSLPALEKLQKAGIIDLTKTPTIVETPEQTISDPRYKPTPILELPTRFERFKGYFQKQNLRDPITGVIRTSEEAMKIFEVPATEKRVSFVDITPTIAGGTRERRAVDYSDINTGTLPPKQNFELQTQKILLDFNRGLITQDIALANIKIAEQKFILDETKRRLPATIAGGVAFGAVSAIAPPIGFTLGGAALVSTVANRKEILLFAKENPKAAAIEFTATIAGAIAGGAGVRGLKGIKAPTLSDPFIKLIGKGRQKFINNIVIKNEPNYKLLLKNKRITGTRAYTIDIPLPKKKVQLKILEFQKDGVKRFYGEEFVKGKRTGLVKGRTITSEGPDGLTKMISRVMTLREKGKLSNIQVSSFIEKAKTKATAVKKTRRFTLTENEAKLVRKFDFNKLTAPEARFVLRKKLFGSNEAFRRIGNAFSEAEFNAAKKLSKTDFALMEDLTAFRLSFQASERPTGILGRQVTDLRTFERGFGKTALEPAIKPKVKIQVKEEGLIKQPKFRSPIQLGTRVKGKGFDAFDFQVKVSKFKFPEPKPKTKLSTTFEETTPKTTPSPTATYIGVGKIIQAQKAKVIARTKAITSTVKQSLFGARVKPTTTTQEVAPRRLLGVQRMVGGEGLTDIQIRDVRDKPVTDEFERLRTPTSLISITKPKQIDKTELLFKQSQKFEQRLQQRQRQQQKQVQEQKQKQKQRMGFPFMFPPQSTFADKTTSFATREGEQGFDVYAIVKKKPKLVQRNLIKEDALDIGTRRVLKDLRATFFLKPSNKLGRDIETRKEFKTYRRLLRKPVKKSRLNKFGSNVFIQKKRKVGRLGGRLAFRGERQEIKRAAKKKARRKRR